MFLMFSSDFKRKMDNTVNEKTFFIFLTIISKPSPDDNEFNKKKATFLYKP